ncbi:MAG: hypothetical protein AAGD14_13595 [Planctomycetota bacterium]
MSPGMSPFGHWREPISRPSHDPDAREALSRADEVEARLNRALLALEALWEIAQEKWELTETELADRILEIDQRDGRLDGRSKRGPTNCPSCGRVISRRFPQCLYCGAVIALDPFR